ncbi:MAG: hypothetical protein ACXWFG_11360 [Methylobacter sp.]
MTDTLHARFWNTSAAGFQYPEVSDPDLTYRPILYRPNTGIAISGGGTVSASLIMGYFYALQEMNVFDNIRYISGVSGGCWGSAPFCFLPENIEDTTYLGGQKYQPAQLTTEILAKVPDNSMTYAVTNADIVDKALEELLLHPFSAYVRAVGGIFLEPFGINGTTRYFTTDANAVSNIIKRNPQLKQSDFITLKDNRPFPIMNTSLMSQNDVDGSSNFPCDCTPLYVGVKALHQGVGMKGQNIGGAFVEPFGFNTPSADNVDQAKGTADVTPGTEIFSLCYPVGTSGEALEQWVMANDPVPRLIFPSYSYWNPSDQVASPVVNAYDFGDGGITDDTGVASLLARGVENIVVFLSEPFDITVAQYEAIGYNQIASLFGQQIYHWKNQAYVDANPNSLMLDPAKFDALKANVQSQMAADGPVFWKDSYTVQANSWFGIAGGWTCNILWIFNTVAPKWAEQLPYDVESLLKTDELSDFPYVKVFKQNPDTIIKLTPNQANMLGNFGYWMATSAESEIKSLLGI